jgi:UDP-N-acetylglucosamine 2-epimerase (non-hydrolysing)
MKTILTVVGTRPEVIKMAKLIELLNCKKYFNHKVCVTGQHKELLKQALDTFSIIPDVNLQIMTHNQSLSDITGKIIISFTEVLKTIKPDMVLVHGDTTTSFACALASFYEQIPVGHVEAGLRTHNKYNPFPEEINRTLTAKIASMHFAPTILNKKNLIREGVQQNDIFITGNTVIDTLLSVSNGIKKCPIELRGLFKIINGTFILVTGHRRENFGDGFVSICRALATIAKKYPTCHIIYPVHPNPNVRDIVRAKIGQAKNIHLMEPLSYIPFVYLMKKSALILTDSGGIQEEAPSLNKPVLVMRKYTERQEALAKKTIQLVGTDTKNIVTAVSEILNSSTDIVVKKNPYGDGHASERIINHLRQRLT